MPLILLDTNALRKMARCDTEQNTAPDRRLLLWLEQACAPGKATALLPRSVFNECTNWERAYPPTHPAGKHHAKGYFDIFPTPDGTFDAALDPAHMNHADNAYLVYWLRQMKEKGQLRVHGNLQSALTLHDEPCARKGGIVILDTCLPHARPYSENGIITLQRRYRPTDHTSAAYSELGYDPAESGIGKGDEELGMLSRCLARYAADKDIAPRYLFLSDDRACSDTVLHRSRTYSTHAQPLQLPFAYLLGALTADGVITNPELRNYIDTGESHLRRFAPRLPSLPHHPHVREAHRWMQDTGIALKTPSQEAVIRL